METFLIKINYMRKKRKLQETVTKLCFVLTSVVSENRNLTFKTKVEIKHIAFSPFKCSLTGNKNKP